MARSSRTRSTPGTPPRSTAPRRPRSGESTPGEPASGEPRPGSPTPDQPTSRESTSRESTSREQLLDQHAQARERRNAAPLGGDAWADAVAEVGRIEVEIARLERELDPPRV